MALTETTWEMYFYPFAEGQRAIVGFDVNAAEEQEHVGWAHGRRIVIFFDPQHVKTSGLPDATDSKRIGDIEEPLVALLEEQDPPLRARLVGRLTYSGRRELVYQTAEPERFDAIVDAWRAAQAGIETKLIDGNGWQFFDDGVRPHAEHWVQIYDRRVIDELVRAGTDPRRKHPLEFTIEGLPPLLVAAARVLEKHGFVLERFKPDVLLIKEPSRLDLDRIWSFSSEFKRLADNRGLKYEGWGTTILPPVEPVPQDELLAYAEDRTPQVVVCPRCFGQIAPNAEKCESCSETLTQATRITLTIDEHAAEARETCTKCGQVILARASVCPSCHRSRA